VTYPDEGGGLIMMGDLLIMMGDLPRKHDGLIVMGDLPKEKVVVSL